ncbi:hypothetical protein MTZ49_01620 [Entomomonas sp. E2T0]|uniref:hypothetical protein n=1 Tax=Entomomonas sp. E2T0 TaxID=2930213 RepID=UPI0022281081|nr:hypothetical protein [Entomomonas sp. E2T0]UYZ84306.1 hypothetical protein MTZ49_01620 [Entomomonas sp. E2T0]
MAKKTKTTVAETTENQELEIVQEVAVQSSIADNSVIASYEIFKAIGRIETSHFYATISDLAIAKQFEEIKNSKKYKDLPYNDADGNVRHVADLEEFCQVFLHKSYRRCAELSQNLNLLGEELYQQAEQIGFRARDYQALKALPADDQEIVKQAIETQDRDKVIELLQEMAVKHKNDKENLTKDLEEAKGSYDALSKVTEKKGKELDKVKLELEKTKKRIANLEPEEVGEELRQEATVAATTVEGMIYGNLLIAMQALQDHQNKTGIDHEATMTGLVISVKRAVNFVSNQLGLPDQLTESLVNDWQAPNAEELVKAELGIGE